MESIREIAMGMAAELNLEVMPRQSESRRYKRLAVIEYANFLREAPRRSVEINTAILQGVHEIVDQAIGSGVSPETIDQEFASLRARWIPKLPEGGGGGEPARSN